MEEIRALELVRICQDFDFVLDFHNTHCPNNDCGFVGCKNWQNSLKLASFFGISKVIVADYDCINKFVPNYLSVEISLSSDQNDVDFWLERMLSLTQFDPNQNLQLPELFQFSRRVSRIEQNKFRFQNWQAFKIISKLDKTVLDLDSKTNFYPIFVDDDFTEDYNFAGLITNFVKRN